MELEHAIITAKAFFPDATVRVMNNGTYLYDDVFCWVLIALEAKDADNKEIKNCLCNEFSKGLEDIWIPIENVDEKKWIKMLRKMQEVED